MNDVQLPNLSNKDLAYVCGLIVGDGHLCFRKERNEYHVVLTGNLRDEKEFYLKTIKPLLKSLFGVDFRVKINKNDNTINIIYYSKKLLQFLSEDVGIPVGSKCDKISIPKVFRKSNILLKSFLQGYADADFCFCLKKRYMNLKYYPVISCASRSCNIIKEISEFLTKLSFNHYVELNKPRFDRRLSHNVVMSSIILYGHDNAARWIKEIGFRNTKTINAIALWKERNSTNSRAQKAIESLI